MGGIGCGTGSISWSRRTVGPRPLVGNCGCRGGASARRLDDLSVRSLARAGRGGSEPRMMTIVISDGGMALASFVRLSSLRRRWEWQQKVVEPCGLGRFDTRHPRSHTAATQGRGEIKFFIPQKGLAHLLISVPNQLVAFLPALRRSCGVGSAVAAAEVMSVLQQIYGETSWCQRIPARAAWVTSIPQLASWV